MDVNNIQDFLSDPDFGVEIDLSQVISFAVCSSLHLLLLLLFCKVEQEQNRVCTDYVPGSHGGLG